MSFKELLKHYKEGTASEEEIKIVEKELEKYESIEEYLMEDLNDDIFLKDEKNIKEVEKNIEENKSIKRSVNKRLAKVVFSSVLIVVLLYIGIFYGYSNIVDMMHYDPTSITQPKVEGYQRPDFYYDMKAYISLNMPEHSIYSFTSQESKGFGEYQASYSLRDLFSDESQRYFVDISKDRLTFALDGIFSTKNRLLGWEGFGKVKHHFSKEDSEEEIEGFNTYTEKKNEETLSYINKLNSLSYISMSIVFEEDLSMEEFYMLSQICEELDFKWVGIRTVEPGTRWSENQPLHLIGFNPNYNDEGSTNNKPDEDKYPLFNYDIREIFKGNISSEKDLKKAYGKSYETHFKSRLSYIKDREEFVEIFDYNSYKVDFYKQSLEYIEKNGVKTYGVLVYGIAEDFLNKIDNVPYDTLHINRVLPTKPNIYR